MYNSHNIHTDNIVAPACAAAAKRGLVSPSRAVRDFTMVLMMAVKVRVRLNVNGDADDASTDNPLP